MKSIKFKIIFLGLVTIMFLTSGFGCKWTESRIKQTLKPVNLVIWRVWDDEDTFNDILTAYKQIHPNVTFTYKNLRYEEYENELLKAWAKDEGPDIFSIPNAWLRKYQDYIVPLPEKITLSYKETSGFLKKEVKITQKTKKSLSLKDLKSNFIDVVYDDAVISDKIYGLPLSVDTLALFYNRDLLNQAQISEAPQNWNQFIEAIKKLTVQDYLGNIIQSGAALGTASNVNRNVDILSCLMLQTGTKMEDGNKVVFDKHSEIYKDYFPGERALEFYTDFANPSKETYTWNEKMPDSLQAFIEGKTAFFFGYSYHLLQIQQQAPKLNFDVTLMPQIESSGYKVNYANYWIETAAKKTKFSNEAWDFIQFAASQEQADKFLSRAKKPTALRSLIEKQSEDFDLMSFAKQLLSAKSWYHGKDFNAVEEIFKEMINQTLKGELSVKDIVKLGVQKVNQTYK
ncbi:MAG: Uncharacterized protein Athens071412_410 [Parcubacteria group bacterium Athens0714_12]|nr:MAG: Uncharacterized protein Athens071412_410 [Parcubacteria group bacterium Athens0714_12]